MPRFDVYPNPGGHADTTPYLLDVQSDLFEDLGSRVVVPLRHAGHFADVALPSRLVPTMTVADQPFILETPKLGAVPSSILKHAVASLAREQARITAALDFLFQGY